MLIFVPIIHEKIFVAIDKLKLIDFYKYEDSVYALLEINERERIELIEKKIPHESIEAVKMFYDITKFMKVERSLI